MTKVVQYAYARSSEIIQKAFHSKTHVWNVHIVHLVTCRKEKNTSN